ncbi:VOC family protein [Amycolatopsis sp. WAC 04182]|uniref:VOC family protein n=1 Tax=Amycolatopsis sp. WAC 04182 TaxID=2203198 RepID=UPI0018F2BBD6|nr:VOC family protein [Amycolatopsis sp. WAC 04182]
MARCSHVLLKVDDLHQAVRDFRELGFVVDYASAEEKAKHAHIWFEDGPIVELLTTPPGAHRLKWPIEFAFGRGSGVRMTRWALANEGFCDVAVLIDEPDLTGPLKALRAEGIAAGRAVRWTRTKPDGAQTRFQFAYPRRDRLPFLVSPYDPPQYPPKVEHPNGAKSLRTVLIDVAAADRPAFDRITGDDPVFAVTEGVVTRVRAIELEGLSGPLDPALLHGAEIR